MVRRIAAAVAAAVLLLAAAIGLLILLGGSARRAEPPRPAVAGAGIASVGVTPVRTDLPGTPAGRPLVSNVRYDVVNHGKTPAIIDVSAGEASTATGARLPESAASASRWVKVTPQRLQLAAGQKGQVLARVLVPAGREPAERRLEIYFRSTPPSSRSVAFAVELGASIWVPGSGPVDNRVALTGLSVPRLANNGFVVVRARVRNVGNVHRDLGPTGTQVIGSTSTGTTFRFDPATVLPKAAATVTGRWHTPLACYCEVQVVVADGRGGLLRRTSHVLVLPWAIALATALLVGAAAGVIPALRSRSGSPGRRST